MTSSDELRRLWQSDIAHAINQRDVLRELERRMRSFDRTIRMRDLRESLAGLLVTAIYLWMAVGAKTMFERGADLATAAWGVWVAVFLRRYFRLTRKPAPEQSLSAYREALVERYAAQIRLAKSVKYWYLLPMWLALLLFDIAYRLDGGNNTKFFLVLAVVSAGSGFVWWLNEGPGIRCLEKKRRDLAALMEEEGAEK